VVLEKEVVRLPRVDRAQPWTGAQDIGALRNARLTVDFSIPAGGALDGGFARDDQRLRMRYGHVALSCRGCNG